MNKTGQLKLIEFHLSLLGLPATDKITGFKGVMTSLSYDVYGCVQMIVTPPITKDGEINNGQWFDITRLLYTHTDKKAMPVPDFTKGYIAEGKKGCATKPLT
jgi:hypothetical protein